MSGAGPGDPRARGVRAAVASRRADEIKATAVACRAPGGGPRSPANDGADPVAT